MEYKKSSVKKGDKMKRKPDVMATLVIVFCVGLVVSGFTTFSYTRDLPKMPTSLVSSIATEAADSGFTRR